MQNEQGTYSLRNVTTSSALLDEAVTQFQHLPGIGRKTALRLALHVLRMDVSEVADFANAFVNLRTQIRYCQSCHNITDDAFCPICTDSKRDHHTICVVETIRDVMAIEQTGQYTGVYHVLGGVISPMEGIGPADLTIDSLEDRVRSGEATEVIMALSTTMEGDTTNFYLYKRLAAYGVKISTIARGVSVGDCLEYADEVTLGSSITNRVPYGK